MTSVLSPSKKRRNTHILNAPCPSRLETQVRRKDKNEEQQEIICGKYNCRRCSCYRYAGKESGGYKCNNCGHYYEDHRS